MLRSIGYIGHQFWAFKGRPDYSHIVACSPQVLLHVLWSRHLTVIKELGGMFQRGQPAIAQRFGVILEVVEVGNDFHIENDASEGK